MKKRFFLLFAVLLASIMMQAQTPETITNREVIKMSKAKLSDELIIEMIQTSPVNFDLSDNAVKALTGESVSEAVIEAMKSAGKGQKTPAVTNQTQVKGDITRPEEEAKIVPPTVAVPVSVVPALGIIEDPAEEPEVIKIEALNYVSPLVDLVKFNENELKSFDQIIKEWDKMMKNNTSEIIKAKGQMFQMENEIRQKKNSDTKAFGNDITSLISKLVAYRGKYEQSKAKMAKDLQDLVKKLETIRSERLRNLDKALSNTSQAISASETNPANGEKAKTADYIKKSFSPGSGEYLVFNIDILAWYQNEILKIDEIIKSWNPKVKNIIQEDNNLKKQLEPLERRLEELKPNAKQNKTEISGLKKQISDIEKERKKLADRMKDDCKDLSDYIKKLSQEDQEAVKDRFDDIIENINYSLQEKFSL